MSIRSHYIGFALVTVTCCLAPALFATAEATSSPAAQRVESAQSLSLAREQQAKPGKGDTPGQFTSASHPRKNSPK
ncbi:MAG: hypothetical protein ACOYKZ_03090 [Chlamydiia bacterium]